MHKIRLYGIVHGGKNVFNLPTNIHPSTGLTANMYGLPEKSRFGIEYFQELYSDGKLYNIDYNGIKIREQTIQYWQEVLDCLHDLKHIPVFLDDLETYKKYLLKSKELGSENMPLKAIFDRNMNERVYRAIVERENIFVVERERKMMERIAKEKPEAVLIGAGHADYLYLTPSFCSKYDIYIKSYSREKLPEIDLLSAAMSLYEAEAALDVQMDFEQNPAVSSFVWSERGFLERNFSAISKGRILPDKKPKYIGTWDTKCPPRGLFEVYPRYNKKKGKLIGRIEDTFGTAGFAGCITDSEVDFVKTYYAGAMSVGGAEAPIRFTGSGGNGFFRGVCGTGNDKELEFELREFNL